MGVCQGYLKKRLIRRFQWQKLARHNFYGDFQFGRGIFSKVNLTDNEIKELELTGDIILKEKSLYGLYETNQFFYRIEFEKPVIRTVIFEKTKDLFIQRFFEEVDKEIKQRKGNE